uniref:RING finger protein 24 n=2 Tax=Metatheria TaxID=9263 RepID=A0A5F8GQB5_MONDO
MTRDGSSSHWAESQAGPTSADPARRVTLGQSPNHGLALSALLPAADACSCLCGVLADWLRGRRARRESAWEESLEGRAWGRGAQSSVQGQCPAAAGGQERLPGQGPGGRRREPCGDEVRRGEGRSGGGGKGQVVCLSSGRREPALGRGREAVRREWRALGARKTPGSPLPGHAGGSLLVPFMALHQGSPRRPQRLPEGASFIGRRSSMSSDFQHYSFRMPNIGFQNLPLNIYIVVFGTAIFVFILSLLFCCYLIRLRHQAHKEFYAYKQVILKEKVKELNLHEICAVCLEDFKPKDELGICPCKHAFHRKCLIKWLEVRKVCPLCNMPVLQLAQLHSKQDHGPPQGPLPGAENIV